MYPSNAYRLLIAVAFAYVAWLFLSSGTVLAAGGLLLVLEARAEGGLLVSIGFFLIHVGMTALEHFAGRQPTE